MFTAFDPLHGLEIMPHNSGDQSNISLHTASYMNYLENQVDNSASGLMIGPQNSFP